MAAASCKYLLLCCCLVISSQILKVSSNVILDCISVLYCNGNAPVCGSNGTHCWRSRSDCERTKFNCLHLNKKDFDKVDSINCKELTIGGIEECSCLKNTCSNRNEPICAQSTISDSISMCRWFKNRCELHNYNCANANGTFKETGKAFCNFGKDNELQTCLKTDGIKMFDNETTVENG